MFDVFPLYPTHLRGEMIIILSHIHIHTEKNWGISRHYPNLTQTLWFTHHLPAAWQQHCIMFADWIPPIYLIIYIMMLDYNITILYLSMLSLYIIYIYLKKKTSLSIIILRNPPFFIISLDYTPFLLVPSPLTDGPGQRGSGSPVAASTGDVQPELPKMGGVGPWKSTKDEDSTTFNM